MSSSRQRRISTASTSACMARCQGSAGADPSVQPAISARISSTDGSRQRPNSRPASDEAKITSKLCCDGTPAARTRSASPSRASSSMLRALVTSIFGNVVVVG